MQQLEAQAALAAVRALIERLGPYLSPYLADLLALLLQPALTQQQGDTASLAAEARGKMCGGVPPRLLIPALAAHFDKAVQVTLNLPDVLVFAPALHVSALCTGSW